METERSVLKKLGIEPPYDLAIPRLGIYLKNKKTLIQQDMYIPMFTAALYITAKIWKQLKKPVTDERIKMYRCISLSLSHTHTNTHGNTTQS